MRRLTLIISIFLISLAFLFAGGCKSKTENTGAVDEQGQPILVDIAGEFQINLPYFEMALERVPMIFRGQFATPEGKREYLERLAVEAIFYLEGVRRKYYRKKEYKDMYNLRLYAGVLEEVKVDMRKKVKIDEAEIRAEYERLIKKRRDERPYKDYRDGIERSMIERAVEKAYQEKKEELVSQWEIKFHYDLLDRLNPAEIEPEKLPKLDDVLAEGKKNYRYTVGQLLKRIEESPEHVREKLRDGAKLRERLEFVVAEEVLFTWAVKNGYDKTASYSLRKTMIKVSTMSYITRKEIIADDIVATRAEAEKFYDENQREFTTPSGLLPFDKVEARARSRATDFKRLEATRSLAKSLMAHRFPTNYFEQNIKKCLGESETGS